MLKKFAIIGCGRISKKHVEAIVNNSDEAILIAVCDITKQKASLIADEYIRRMKDKGRHVKKPNVYIDYMTMIDLERIDIVTIATESGKHARISINCMQNRINVIVEKPMAMNVEDANRMIECSTNYDVKLCVSHQNRFNPCVQKLRQAIENNRFGKIFAGSARVLWNRNENYYKQAVWRGTKEQDGGCLMNQCIHNIDLLQWMLGGKVENVHAVLRNYNHPYIEQEDYGSLQICFHGGAVGNIEGTVCVYPQNLEETLTIIGERGTVVLGGKAINKVMVWQFKDEKDTFEEVQESCNQEIDNIYGMGHTPLFKDMIKSISYDSIPYVSGKEGIKALDIICRAYSINQ